MAAARVIGKALPRCRAALGRKGNCRGFSSGGRSSDDLDVQALLSDIPPSKSKNAASSEAGPKMWESVMKEPSQASISPEWDFLGELHASQLKHSQNRFSFSSSSSKASTSSRSLADDGFDFLAEDHQRPSPSPKEPALEPRDLPEQNLFHAASFKLIRDTFAKAPSDTGKKLVRDSLGGDSSALFFEPSSKEVDPRSLAEVEDGRFFSTKDPALTLKTYTYAELGEKLRNARPPKEQILSSAVGLSFGELRTRIQTIEAEEYKDTSQEFWDLKASLAELKSFKKDPTRQLSCKLLCQAALLDY
ncbi:hypothetical protein L7F22_008486 [Adiantum nelumboides]|nr:hypothetical protein [Adiantum nelumboides]